MSAFRDRLIATLRAVQPVLDVPGVVIVGSEVPNLIEPDAASTLVVSQGVDIAIPLAVHDDVVRALPLVSGLVPSKEEPSVWLPADDSLCGGWRASSATRSVATRSIARCRSASRRKASHRIRSVWSSPPPPEWLRVG